MDSTSSAAHRRVGAAAVLAFLAFLALGVTRNNSAAADPVVPAATPTVQPGQQIPQGQAPPRDGGGGFVPGGEERDGDGGGGFRRGGGGFGGGGTAPAPSTAGSTGGTTT